MIKRIRGTTLQNIRRKHFKEHPLCVMCDAKGIVTLATDLDHIIALTNGGADVPSNRQGLCHPCHEEKTAIDLGHVYTARKTIGADGWPVE